MEGHSAGEGHGEEEEEAVLMEEEEVASEEAEAEDPTESAGEGTGEESTAVEEDIDMQDAGERASSS